MTYAYQVPDLLALLRTKVPKAEELASSFRRVERGLLSVGLKIHCLDDGRRFDQLIEGLGGPRQVLDVNYYKNSRASICLVLPPVGSATSAITLLECIGEFIGSPIFGDPKIQLQMCSPGRLGPRASALLGIGFYLGSDTLRRYTQADLHTTFSARVPFARGTRLILYDAEGDFDRRFDWLNRHGVLELELPFVNGRTDILIGTGSKLDIEITNFLATLLVHSEYGGYWQSMGERFAVEMEELLERHILSGLLSVSWVRQSWAQIGDDDRFFSALQELVAYAYGESARVKQRRLVVLQGWRDIPARPPNGILQEMRSLLVKYRNFLGEAQSRNTVA